MEGIAVWLLDWVVKDGIRYLVYKLVELSTYQIQVLLLGPPPNCPGGMSLVIGRDAKGSAEWKCEKPKCFPGLVPTYDTDLQMWVCVPPEWLCPDEYYFGGLDKDGNPICWPKWDDIMRPKPVPEDVDPLENPENDCEYDQILQGRTLTQAQNICNPPQLEVVQIPPEYLVQPRDPKMECYGKMMAAGIPQNQAFAICFPSTEVKLPPKKRRTVRKNEPSPKPPPNATWRIPAVPGEEPGLPDPRPPIRDPHWGNLENLRRLLNQ